MLVTAAKCLGRHWFNQNRPQNCVRPIWRTRRDETRKKKTCSEAANRRKTRFSGAGCDRTLLYRWKSLTLIMHDGVGRSILRVLIFYMLFGRVRATTGTGERARITSDPTNCQTQTRPTRLALNPIHATKYYYLKTKLHNVWNVPKWEHVIFTCDTMFCLFFLFCFLNLSLWPSPSLLNYPLGSSECFVAAVHIYADVCWWARDTHAYTMCCRLPFTTRFTI